MTKISLIINLLLVSALLGGCYNLEKDISRRVKEHYLGYEFKAEGTVVPKDSKIVIRNVKKTNDEIIAIGFCDAYESKIANIDGSKMKTRVYFRVKFKKIKPDGILAYKYSQIVLDFPENSRVVQVFWNNEEDVFMKFAYDAN